MKAYSNQAKQALHNKKNSFYKTILSKSLFTIVLLSVLLLLSQNNVYAQNTMPKPKKSGYADVNGIKLYYETYGEGQPLILLHGGFGMTGMFSAIIPTLSEKHEVIAVDLQAHGRTADINRPMTFEAMSDDIVGLIKYLGLSKTDIMGYSVGGGVALCTVIHHPELIHRAVIVSAPFKHSAFYPDIIRQQQQMGPQSAEAMKQMPFYAAYKNVAPKPEDWQSLVTKLGQLINRDYDWSQDIKNIKTPMLLVCGDADIFPPTHAVEFFSLLGGGQKDGGWDGSGKPQAQLAILPHTSHYEIFMSPALAATAARYLDAPDK